MMGLFSGCFTMYPFSLYDANYYKNLPYQNQFYTFTLLLVL